MKVRKTVPTDQYTCDTQVHKVKKVEPEVCPDCGGWGTLPNGFDGNPEMCRSCQGTGEIV